MEFPNFEITEGLLQVENTNWCKYSVNSHDVTMVNGRKKL